MVEYFRPFMVNYPIEDPALYISLNGEKKAILVDCGETDKLSYKELQRIHYVFISHTHIDHFIGFDNVLRASVGLPKNLYVFGPENIAKQVFYKVSAYTWNLICDKVMNIYIYELTSDEKKEYALYNKEKFEKLNELNTYKLDKNKLILKEENFEASFAILDHKIPSLAYSFKEADTFLMDKEKLEEFEHTPGPWIKTLKDDLSANKDLDSLIKIDSKDYTLGFLKNNLIKEKKGRKISYVTDTIYNEQTEKDIIDLVYNSDIFYCESHFAESEKDKAKDYFHLTAKQAGTLAKKAKVKDVIGFHYSPRYIFLKQKLLERELREAFELD